MPVTCYLCGRDYGRKSYGIHHPVCLEKWKKECEKGKNKRETREPNPPKDHERALEGELNGTELKVFNEESLKIWKETILVQCLFCKRTFFPHKLIKHQKFCTAENPMKNLKQGIGNASKLDNLVNYPKGQKRRRKSSTNVQVNVINVIPNDTKSNMYNSENDISTNQSTVPREERRNSESNKTFVLEDRNSGKSCKCDQSKVLTQDVSTSTADLNHPDIKSEKLLRELITVLRRSEGLLDRNQLIQLTSQIDDPQRKYPRETNCDNTNKGNLNGLRNLAGTFIGTIQEKLRRSSTPVETFIEPTNDTVAVKTDGELKVSELEKHDLKLMGRRHFLSDDEEFKEQMREIERWRHEVNMAMCRDLLLVEEELHNMGKERFNLKGSIPTLANMHNSLFMPDHLPGYVL